MSHYTRLGVGQIRLLSIESNGRKLNGRLSNYFLENAPEFRAISYAWSHVPLSAVIGCDGSPLRLTPDLHDALMTMSRELPPGSHFWIDALCIAQDNPEEKAQQVQQIHEVFKRAHEVLVWLGPSADDSEWVMSRIPTLTETLRASPAPAPIQYGNMLAAISVVPGDERRLWGALFGLCRRHWFSRVWTFQEATLAKAARLFCGQDSCELSGLLDLLHFFYQHGYLNFLVHEYAPGSDPDELYLRTTNLVLACRKSSERDPLPLILERSETRDCTEPVDRIYGILGMMPEHVRSSVPVNYTIQGRREYWKLWAIAAKLALQETGSGNLQILGFCDRSLIDENLPTWCPNWASTLRVGRLTFDESLQEREHTIPRRYITSIAYYAKHRAGIRSNLVRDVTFPSWRVLRTQGVVVDEVATVLDPPLSWSSAAWYSFDSLQRMRTLASYLESCNRFCCDQFDQLDLVHSLIARDKIMAHTMLALEENSNAEATGCEQVLRAVLAYAEVSGRKEVDNDYLYDSHEAHFHNRLSYIWPGRAFFVTKHGRPGIGSKSILPGDKVCVLFGGMPCYILREHPDNQHWHFKYEAYLHGLMSGQVFGMLERGEVQQQYFNII